MPAASLIQIYLSPHLDDAVLSCGGMLHRQAQTGARVVVVTVCTGAPPSGPISPFAQTLHERWASGGSAPAAPAEVVAQRRAEDLAALTELNAQGVHLDVPDAIYRLNQASGWPMYGSEAAIFGSLHSAEVALVRRVATKLTTLLHGFGRHHLYVPLGVGQHVDHQLARRAAELAGGIYAYYEDYPYVAKEGDRWPGPAAPEAHGRALIPEFVRLSEADLAGKIKAIGLYASQIGSFWAAREAMGAAVRQFADQVGGSAPAERIWRVT